jgi:hypothetical protein
VLLGALTLTSSVRAETAKAVPAKADFPKTEPAKVDSSKSAVTKQPTKPGARKASRTGKLPELRAPRAAEAAPVASGATEARRRAIVALDTGHYDQAIPALEEAYALDQDPFLLFRLAQAYRLAGQPSKALEACEAYLRAADGNAAERAQVERILGEVEMITYQMRLQREYGLAAPARTALTPALTPPAPAPLALQPPPVAPEAAAPAAVAPAAPLPLPTPRVEDTESSLTKSPTPAPLDPTPPFYRRTPFWVAVGGAVVAGAAVAWYTQTSHGSRAPQTTLGYQQAFP